MQVMQATSEQLARACEVAREVATQLNTAVKRAGIIGNDQIDVGLHCVDLANAAEADAWLPGAVDDLDTQFLVGDGMRFRAGNLGSVWVDTTLTGTLKNGKRHRKHVRVFWRGFSEDRKMLIGLDVTFEPDFLTESTMP